MFFLFFFSSRRRHTRLVRDWSSDVCSSDLSAPRCQTSFTRTTDHDDPNSLLYFQIHHRGCAEAESIQHSGDNRESFVRQHRNHRPANTDRHQGLYAIKGCSDPLLNRISGRIPLRIKSGSPNRRKVPAKRRQPLNSPPIRQRSSCSDN